MNKKNGLSRYRQRKRISLFCADVTATQAALLAGLNRNTVNRYFRLFREAIHAHQTGLQVQLCGTVEVDESYFGPTRIRGKAGRGRGLGRQPVFGIIERGGRVFTEIGPDVKKKTLQALIRGHVAPGTVIVSDGFRADDGLVDVGYDKHLRLNKYYDRDRPKFAENGGHSPRDQKTVRWTVFPEGRHRELLVLHQAQTRQVQRNSQTLRTPPQGMRVEVGQRLRYPRQRNHIASLEPSGKMKRGEPGQVGWRKGRFGPIP